jgi:FKBP-type peptidyl-prolyl cis-trans isomerase
MALKKITLIAAAGLVLAGCAADTQNGQPVSAPAADYCDSYTGGSAVEQISVSGEFGQMPQATFPIPLSGTGVETAVISAGDGPRLVGNQRILIQFAGYNTGTGLQFQASDFGDEFAIPQDIWAGGSPDFCKALTGVTVGSRVAVLLSPESAHGELGVPSFEIGPDQGVLFIFDVVDAFLPRATGTSVAPQSGFPNVILAPSGQPGIQVAGGEAPSEFRSATLIQGSGEALEIGDSAVVHYTGWIWNGTQFDSSWDRQRPAEFNISTANLIEGFVLALDGVKVGSQIIAIIPPELGYGSSAQGSIPANSTLIFVVDVLGKVKPRG